MTQKAEHNFQSDYYSSSTGQGYWIWGTLAAIAALGLIIWLAAYSGPSTTSITNSPSTEQVAPPPAAPAQPPAAGGTQNPQ